MNKIFRRMLAIVLTATMVVGMTACSAEDRELAKDAVDALEQLSGKLDEVDVDELAGKIEDAYNDGSSNTSGGETKPAENTDVTPTHTPDANETPTPTATSTPAPTEAPKYDMAEQKVYDFIKYINEGKYEEALALTAAAGSPFVSADDLKHWIPRSDFWFVEGVAMNEIEIDGTRKGGEERVTVKVGDSSVRVGCFLNDSGEWTMQLEDFVIENYAFEVVINSTNVQLNGASISITEGVLPADEVCIGVYDVYVIPYIYPGMYTISYHNDNLVEPDMTHTVEVKSTDSFSRLCPKYKSGAICDNIYKVIGELATAIATDYHAGKTKEEIVGKYYTSDVNVDAIWEGIQSCLTETRSYQLDVKGGQTLAKRDNDVNNVVSWGNGDIVCRVITLITGKRKANSIWAGDGEKFTNHSKATVTLVKQNDGSYKIKADNNSELFPQQPYYNDNAWN